MPMVTTEPAFFMARRYLFLSLHVLYISMFVRAVKLLTLSM